VKQTRKQQREKYLKINKGSGLIK